MMRIPAAAMMLLVACSMGAAANAQQGETQNQGGYTDAMVPVEALAPDPDSKGEVRGFGFRLNAVVIAEQPARVWRAVVAQEPSGAGARQLLLNLALLGPVRADAAGRLLTELPPDQVAWCESDSRKRATIRCFQDLDADGKFEMLRTGLLPRLDALAVNRVSGTQPTTPISYRDARPDELPRLQLRYISCPEKEPVYKYAQVIQHLDPDGSQGTNFAGDCTAVATALSGDASGSGLYQVGRFKVFIQEEGDKKVATLAEGIPAGTLLGHVRADRPFTDAVQAKGYREDQNTMSGGLPFLYFVAPPQVASTDAAPGTEIVSGEVAHAITGKLSAPLIKLGYLGRKEELPAGTPMYGVLMNRTTSDPNLDPEIVWCAPDKTEPNSRCAIRGPVGHKLVRNFERFNVGTLSVGSSDQAILAPLVERQSVDFGAPIRLSIKFDKWEKRYAILVYSFGFESQPGYYMGLRLRRAADGAAYLVVGGKVIKLRPAISDPNKVSLEYQGSIETGSDAQPMDAVELRKAIAAGE